MKQPSPEEWTRVSEAWHEKRERMARDFGVEVESVPVEAVWFLRWPQPDPSPEDMARGRELLRQLYGGWD